MLPTEARGPVANVPPGLPADVTSLSSFWHIFETPCEFHDNSWG